MKWVFSLLLLWLTGCVSLHVTPGFITNQSLSWKLRQDQLSDIQNWHIQGVMGMRTSKQALSATFTWLQQHDNYTLQIFGPLGINSVRLIGSGNQVSLQTGKQTFTANTPENLIQQQLGWQLPVSNLYYWIRGLPAPDFPAKAQLDPANHLQRLTQQGWEITYDNYQTINHVDMPTTIHLSQAPIQIKLIIKAWDISG